MRTENNIEFEAMSEMQKILSIREKFRKLQTLTKSKLDDDV
jgi:hypothetical protein